MKDRHVLFSALVVAAVVALLHGAAIERYWYFLFWWMDVLMHVLGGVVIGLLLLWLASYWRDIRSNQVFWWVLLGVLLVGVGWELFEVYADLLLTDMPFPDTLHDIGADLVGGIIAYLFTFSLYNHD